MKIARCLILLIPVLLFSHLYSQLTITHGKADSYTVTNFHQQTLLPETYKIKRPEEPEKHEAPRHFRLPPGSHVKHEDTSRLKAPTQARAMVVSPAPSANFAGVTDNLTLTPPDVQGAAGINYLMISLNSQVQILTKAGTVISTISLPDFWPTAWWSTNPNAFFSDPRILYDPYSARWILVTLFLNDNQTTGVIDLGQLFIAVSQTDDPTGNWNTYRITEDPTNETWVDYPYIGFSNKWIIITGNMEPVTGDDFYPNELWVLDKNNFYSGGAGNYTTITDNSVSLYISDTVGTAPSMVPAVTFDSTLGTHYLVQTWDASHGLIKLSAITGAVGAETLTSIAFVQSAATWASEAAGGSFFDQIAPQKGIRTKIATNYDDMQGLVYRNGTLWGVQGIFLPATHATRSSIQWWNMDTTGTIIQRSQIDDPAGNNFYAFPSITVNSQNDALIGYTVFNKKQFPSAAYSFHGHCDALNTFDSTYIYRTGDSSYFKTWDSNERWGDETAACIDPVNDVDIWTLQEYATTWAYQSALSAVEGRWATWWAEVSPVQIINGGPGTWTWTGDMDTNWFNPCNWDQGTLPNIQSDVVIPGGTTNNPTVKGSVASCNTITVNSSTGGLLTVDMPNGGLLTVAQ